MDVFQQEYEKIKSEISNCAQRQVFATLKEKIGDSPLVLYGAGDLANLFLDYCEEFSFPVACICDTYKTGVHVTRHNTTYNIINMGTLKRDFYDAVVCICSRRYNDEIYESLGKNGFPLEHVVRDPFDGLPVKEPSWSFERHKDGYSWAYHFFEEQRSRLVVLDRMRCALTGKRMSQNTFCERYYEDGFISLGENEIFVDGGAYNGGTVEQFIRKTEEAGVNYKYIYSFEPCAVNYEKTVRRLSTYANIEVIPKGLWSMETERSFFDDNGRTGSASFAHRRGVESRVSVMSLDSLFQCMPSSELPTFIKMDIEGSEKEALLGAANVLQRIKPKLAICAYHKMEDIYELPQTILSIRNDYKLILRKHECGHNAHSDTILYAI